MKNEGPQLRLELTIDEINLVLNALGQMPYVQVAGIIGKISKQVETQWKAAED